MLHGLQGLGMLLPTCHPCFPCWTGMTQGVDPKPIPSV